MQAWDRQIVPESQPYGRQPLFPVAPVLVDDIFDIIFINQKIPVHDGIRRFPAVNTLQDILLILKRDLGVWNEQGEQKRVGFMAFRAKNSLD